MTGGSFSASDRGYHSPCSSRRKSIPSTDNGHCPPICTLPARPLANFSLIRAGRRAHPGTKGSRSAVQPSVVQSGNQEAGFDEGMSLGPTLDDGPQESRSFLPGEPSVTIETNSNGQVDATDGKNTSGRMSFGSMTIVRM